MLWTSDARTTDHINGRPVLRGACALLLAIPLGACGATPPPEEPKTAPTAEPVVEPAADEPVEPEAFDTGMACMTAMTKCEGGVCLAEMQNNCDKPVTCDMSMYALCKGTTTGGQARGTARDTFRAGDGGTMEAGANCEGASVPITAVDTIRCSAEVASEAAPDAAPAAAPAAAPDGAPVKSD
ncbi:MAG: hypothetical protein DRI90_24570 [Deltaproteobacteria bacterium]|nr:MAG: hypothetical protein DRI90_24570 [Deltaproteobacteria bacterium]